MGKCIQYDTEIRKCKMDKCNHNKRTKNGDCEVKGDDPLLNSSDHQKNRHINYLCSKVDKF